MKIINTHNFKNAVIGQKAYNLLKPWKKVCLYQDFCN